MDALEVSGGYTWFKDTEIPCQVFWLKDVRGEVLHVEVIPVERYEHGGLLMVR